MKSSQKVGLTVEDDVEVVTTAPSCGDSLSQQTELRLATSMNLTAGYGNQPGFRSHRSHWAT